jgi:hypothetical protein
MDNVIKSIEGHPDLVKNMKTGAVINTNHDAYAAAKKRAAAAQAQRDEIRNTTREINNIKCEMHEIKSLLTQLVTNK